MGLVLLGTCDVIELAASSFLLKIPLYCYVGTV